MEDDVASPPGASHRIPQEVLSEIFMFYGLFHDYRASKLNQLCLVDRTWHSVAMTTPRLWCRIRIGADDPDSDYKVDLADDEQKSRNEQRIESLARYTSRSGIAPLDVSIYHITWDQGYPDILEILGHSMNRWRSLHIVNHNDAEPYQSLSYCIDALPSLEKLSLCSNSGNGVDSTYEHLPFVPTSRLKELTMEGAGSIPFLLFTSLPLDLNLLLPCLRGLTSLTFKHLKADRDDQSCSSRIYPMLREAPNLEFLTLHTPDLTWDDSLNSDCLELPVLRRLSISSWRARERLRPLTAPALESLWFHEVCGSDEFPEPGVHVITDFIERSAPPLRELYIGDDALDTRLFDGGVLSTLCELEVLTLVGMDIPEDGMQLLWAPLNDSTAWACPRLRSFSASKAPVAYFLRLLEARNPPLGSSCRSNTNIPARLTHIGCGLDAQDMEAISEALGAYPTRVK
ncbi:hypothetical protein BOTBODRAFT_51598 [Botryobasidium botryosum FD-172 SS1]|uniref:Uncharacterized protein n=1 Tax=Botryobasidium botryosum (strain FD-172 SS1) TaxID=930990 RepID=A0A067MXF3_BOTB1|nr:hypothetical protein BOTBODRAFT_51598 [Botryobasidium botryosum FD-172 SS1]